MFSFDSRWRSPRQTRRLGRFTRVWMEELETRLAPSTMGQDLWANATGTPAASTLAVGLAPGTDSGISLLTPAATAAGATVVPTSLPDLFTVNGTRDVLTGLISAYQAIPGLSYA